MLCPRNKLVVFFKSFDTPIYFLYAAISDFGFSDVVFPDRKQYSPAD